METSLNSHLFD